MRVRLVVAAVLLALAVPVTALAQDATTTTLPPSVDSPSIIPKPNQGIEPQDAGDRGGALQALTFVLIIGGVGAIGAAVWRQSVKARRNRVEI